MKAKALLFILLLIISAYLSIYSGSSIGGITIYGTLIIIYLNMILNELKK